MQPQGSTFNYREDLSLTIDEFDNQMNEQGFVAHKLFPLVPREEKSGKMPRIPLEERLQEVATRRNADGTFNRVRHEWADDNYDTQSHGLEALLDDEVVKRYDSLIDAEAFEGDTIEATVMRNYEKETVDYATTHTNYESGRIFTASAGSPALGAAWTLANRASAVPITDIDIMREAFFLDLGQEPNALVVNREMFRNLINTTQIVDRSKSQGFQDVRSAPMAANVNALAMALDLDKIIVANAVKGTVPGGSRTLTRIWPSTRAVLCRVATSDNPREVCWGRTMIWSPFGAIGADGRMGVLAESYDEPQRAGSILRRRANWGRKVLHAEAAYLYKTA